MDYIGFKRITDETLKNFDVLTSCFKDKNNHENFKIEGFERDKKTYILLKCNKCDFVNKKAQDLFKNFKTICCNNCERKQCETMSVDRLVRELNEYGATFIEYNTTIKFKCKCGKEDNKHYFSKNEWQCKDCSFNNYWGRIRTDVDIIRKHFYDNGCTPIFNDLDYKNTNSSLKYICVCGIETASKFSHLKNKAPRCKRCNIPKGENHHSWKGGGEKNRSFKRYKDEEWWYRKIKRIFNYTCVISGIKGSKKNVAHHLDSYSMFPEKCLDIKNGICITKELHKEFHSTYDKYTGKCTIDDFADFYYKKTGQDFFELMEKTNYDIE